jgi:hypothetical protein
MRGRRLALGKRGMALPLRCPSIRNIVLIAREDGVRCCTVFGE